MKVTVERLYPTKGGIRVDGLLSGPGGWVRFLRVDVPWSRVDLLECQRALEKAMISEEEREPEGDPLF